MGAVPVKHVYTVIMAGGAGTRFWPASRASHPKQFLALGPDPDESLLAATVRRIADLSPIERVLVVTGKHLVSATMEALPRLPSANVLAEPAPRNTAACIAWATAVVARSDRDGIIAVLPSDHVIGDEPAFRQTIERALKVAASGTMTTIGIKPTRAETGYGYIEVGRALDPHSNAVSRFVEKPNRERAEEFVRTGGYLWNSGMFFFRARDMLHALETYCPELAAGIGVIERAVRQGDGEQELARTFPRLPSISIDHAVMEKVQELAVIPGDFDWSDVGSWQSAWELSTKDLSRNAGPEAAVFVDARGNLVRDLRTDRRSRVIAVIGASDLVIVETDDALLVVPRDRAQDVRLAIEALRARGTSDVL